MTFNPEIMGFTPVTRRGCARPKRSGCILSTTTSGKSSSGRSRTSIRMTLDEDTTKLAVDMFGDKCGVAVDESARIVLYEGINRRLSTTKNDGGRAAVSLGSETERFVKALGSFVHYVYRSEIYAGGEAILLAPVNKLD